MTRLGRFLLTSAMGALMTTTAFAQGAMTDVGTPRSETLIVQTFDGRSANPSAQNPLNSYESGAASASSAGASCGR